MIPNSFFVNGNISTEVRSDVFKSIQEKKLDCVISTVGKEALDIPTLDVVVNAEGFESSVATIQRMRSLTASKDKNVGIIIDFIDKGKYLEDSSRVRQKRYESIKGFIIKHKKIMPNHYSLEESRWI